MLPDIEILLKIQHFDQLIAKFKKSKEEIPIKKTNIKSDFDYKQELFNEKNLEFQKTDIAIKNLEIDIETRKDKISRLIIQQFKTRKNEEFQSIGREIENYKKEIIQLEDKELELLEQSESNKSKLNILKKESKELKDDMLKDIENLNKQNTDLDCKIKEEIEKRNNLSPKISKSLLDLYERLFKSKSNTSIAALTDEICQGCHMKVIKSTISEVKEEKNITHCENCGRILYWWTDES